MLNHSVSLELNLTVPLMTYITGLRPIPHCSAWCGWALPNSFFAIIMIVSGFYKQMRNATLYGFVVHRQAVIDFFYIVDREAC